MSYLSRLRRRAVAWVRALVYASLRPGATICTEVAWRARPGQQFDFEVVFIGVADARQQILRGYYGRSRYRQYKRDTRQ